MPRVQTSFTLDSHTLDTLRRCAKQDGMNMSAWLDRAIRRAAAEHDTQLYEQWRESWTAEDHTIEAAFTAADAQAGLA